MEKTDQSTFTEKWLSFFIPFLGLAWFIKKKNRKINMIGFIVNLILCISIVVILIYFLPFPKERFSYLGQKPICNLKEDRAMHFGSFVFVLCYRCTFLILGTFVSFIGMYIRRIKIHWVLILFSVIFILPCFLDGLFQVTTPYVSTNLVRSMTGFLAGVGFGYLLYLPFKKWNLFL